MGLRPSKELRAGPNSSFDGQEPETTNRRVDYLLDQLPGFTNINCSAILAGEKNEIEKAKHWKIPDFSPVWKQIDESDNQCKALKQPFVFLDHPLSSDEAEYPIAYGALVYENPEQVTYMLSSLYRPNNVFVFMVDQKASDEFKERIQLFSKCFSNVIVEFTEKPVEWGGYEITKAVFETVRTLTESKFKWKYFQYLTGFTLPLKTNLRMTRIFKELNGTVNVEILKFPTSRLASKQKNEADSPLPLFKSSLSATFPKETAEAMINSAKVQEFLEDTDYSDETMWGTILGNPEVLQIPG